MSLMSLSVWFLIVTILFGVIVSKYNNRLAEARFADELACVLNTNDSCWKDRKENLLPKWQREVINDDRMIRATYEEDGRVFERFAHPRHIRIRNRGFRYLLNEKYDCPDSDRANPDSPTSNRCMNVM